MPEPSNFMNQIKKEESQHEENKSLLGTVSRNFGIREIDLKPPEIHGRNTVGLNRIVNDKIITDSTHHRNGEIKRYKLA